LPDVGLLKPITPSITQSGKLWRTTVLEKWQAIIDEKNKYLPENSVKNMNKTFQPNEVKIVNKEYLLHTFQSTNTKDNNLIKSCIETFHLNTDQRRAFCIMLY
jgi:hypothetical protein